jgi:hypothetical protein
MVDLALSTLALAIFSRTQKHPPTAKEASLRYGRLLRAAQGQITQVTIRRCDEKGFDQFLLAIILMAWYETTMYCPANLNPNWPSSLHSWSHHDGAMAILKAWNDKQKENAPSSIIRQSRRGLLRSAIFRNCSLPDWIQNGNRFGEHGLDLAFDGIFIRVVNLRHAVKNLERKERPEAAEAEALKNKARELDDECREWALQIPSEWSFDSNSIPSSWPRRDFYSSIIYTCARKSYASVWLHYFALRMLINSTLLKLLQLSHPPQLQADDSLCQEERCECMTKLTAIADSFASTISFSLGRFKANAANAPDSRPTLTLNTDEEIPPALALPTVWPLSVASSLDDIKQSQQLWFRAQLARIGRVIGDGVLELLEPTNELTTD